MAAEQQGYESLRSDPRAAPKIRFDPDDEPVTRQQLDYFADHVWKRLESKLAEFNARLAALEVYPPRRAPLIPRGGPDRRHCIERRRGEQRIG